MRHPSSRFLQTFSLLIGALALVFGSAGLVGASQPERDGTSATSDVADDGDNAHPSGKDRSVEPGGSGTQGNAQSDPDDDGRGPDRSNGGADKPGGEGGVDKDDQDGNNGCGNDDDFEDDNEGLCLGRDGAPGQQPDDDDNDDDTGDNEDDTGDNEDDTGDNEDDTGDNDDDNGDEGDDGTDEGDDDSDEGDDGDDVDVIDDGEGTDEGDGADEGGETVEETDSDTDVEGDEVVQNPVTPATPAEPEVNPATPASPAQPAVESATDRNTQVLGAQTVRSLPRTGDENTYLAALGLGLVLLGFGFHVTSTRLRAARTS
ncbi:LPXTG cell wall anchor domain-containing protein [Acidimicrobiia bacterium EGI L10123]|uniref:LPXTG cell wall anchor domain-containing protein n=1 Tax=Salinilacustrithrix flava TaxID=2957203 RepID=UPI003D7C1E37|nr:LPXTG cell wall anchor domain-containing protein [Acidimicrobiia bacterium EGI L10123]